MCCMSATRTQVYLTVEQRAGLDARARVERKTMAHVIRDAVDTYLASDVGEAERDRLLADTFGACPGLAERVPSRDEWDRGSAHRG
jgi:hypothetical protein